MRLATPPPVVVTPPPGSIANGEPTNHIDHANQTNRRRTADSWNETILNPPVLYTEFPPSREQPPPSEKQPATSGGGGGDQGWRAVDFETPDGNCDEIECLFASELLDADWLDEHGNLAPTPSIEEVFALVRVSIENISKEAETKEQFLLNVSCRAGAGHMLRTGQSSIQRKYVGPDHTDYLSRWELQFGNVRGTFSSLDRVPHSRWRKDHQTASGTGAPLPLDGGVEVPADGDAAAKYWRKRYTGLLQAVKSRNDHVHGLKKNAVQFLRSPPECG